MAALGLAELAFDRGDFQAAAEMGDKFPANYAIPAHSHPTDEHVVVTTGALTFGMGDKLTKGTATKASR